MTYKFDKKIFLRNLKELRQKANLTQNAVDKALGLRSLTIFDYERGRLKVPIEVAVKLCNLYNCSLETLFSIQSNEPHRSDELSSPLKFFPILQSGLDKKRYYMIHHTLLSDPVIMSELGLNEIQEVSSPLDELTKHLDKKSKKIVVVEILKYLNSLITIDHSLDEREEKILETISHSTGCELTQNEYLLLYKVRKTRYFGDPAIFNSKALKRYVIWIMSLVANSDNYLDPREKEYIQQVNELLHFNLRDYNFIEGKIKSMYEL